VSGTGREKTGGPEIIFLHPIGLDRHIWADVLMPGATALDFPGHGDAESAEAVTLDHLVNCVLSRLSGPATLIGLSLGGMVAQQVAVREPGAVASLVVACSTSASNPQAMTERAVATRRNGMAGILDTTLERWFTPQALAAPGHPGVGYARRRLLADDREVVAGYWEAMAEHDVAAQLGSITVPATFIAGASDRASSVEALDRMARAVPGAVLEVVDGPHMLPLERPREFRAALDRHLRRAFPDG
jgi:pimeloyl-ACP methyl ester carboxylesterase